MLGPQPMLSPPPRTQSGTCTHTRTHPHALTHTHTHTHGHTRAHGHTHVHTLARTHRHTRMHAHVHTYMCTQTHLHALARTHRPTALPSLRSSGAAPGSLLCSRSLPDGPPSPLPPPQTSSAPRLCPEGPWPLTPAKPQCAGPSRGLQSHLDLLPAGWARSPARFLSDRRGAGVLNEPLSSKVAVRGFSSCQLRNSKNRQRAGDTGRKSRLQRTRRPRPRSRNEK